MPLSTLDIPGARGVIGMMACPGRNYPVVGRPPMRSRIAHDLRELQQWGASGLVTLVEHQELQSLDIQQLPAVAHELRLWWRHLPIADREIPGWAFERGWDVEGPWIRDQLRAGARVVLHCHAGLGRTGTVAARLLVEFGLSPGQAIEAVRKARPGAIETPWQESYITGLQPGKPPRRRRF